MEAASITETASVGPPRKASDVVNTYALPGLLLVALVAQFIYEPTGTLNDVKTGLSNGTIWALIALGYTLVYGIVELINFAHGEVFMLGSIVAVSIWQTFGIGITSGPALQIVMIIFALAVAMPASGSLHVLLEPV